ncbi:hypothetical protein [Paenibacillus monticola]|uniref:Uncharacterized protein n=1 Tax=Paenibacillus monticola TaxID=2666075 RepID=A0A7X2H5A8_9BACL|nr:hypothetical protein [Paenibacillus monticola]MRN53801.1 hypothetical protein [Paenibacillus monticola]
MVFKIGVYHSDMRYFPISFVDDELILKWCGGSPDTSYLVLAASIIPYRNTNENSVGWTPLALEIINRAADPVAILEEFKPTVLPLTWSGSRLELMLRRFALFNELTLHQNDSIKEWAINAMSEFQKKYVQRGNQS